MTSENILVFAILAGAILLFVSGRLRVDVVALLVLVTLVFSGLLTPEQAFSGFASPAVITVWAVFIISGAMFRSGVADMLARLMMRLAGRHPVRLLTVLMLTAGLMSAFMNNIGAVAILLPAVVSISRQLEQPPSRFLMPLAFAALLGGNITLVGTPPNILASSLLEDYARIESFSFFDFAPMGLIALGAGIAYMLLIGRHLLPDRTPGGELAGEYPVRDYLTEMRVAEGSPLVGLPLSETRFGENYDLNVLQVLPPTGPPFAPIDGRPIQAGDVLLIEGSPRQLLALSQTEGLDRVEEWHSQEWLADAWPQGLKLAEVILAPRATVGEQTLREINFRRRYGLSVLAIRHGNRSQLSHLGDTQLQFGDVLLVGGPPERIELLHQNDDFIVLDMTVEEARRPEKAPLAIFILLGALVVVTTGWLDVSVTLLAGALLLIIGGVLTMEEAYEAIDWTSVFLIAGMLPMGIAMETTGTALLMANWLVELIGNWGAVAVLGGLFLMTALMTEVISNAAATVLMVPIAIDAALGLGASPRAFVMGVVIAASTSFLMPIGHQVNVIIFGPGGYRFSDYARVGIGLNLLMLLIVLFILPLVWPLFP